MRESAEERESTSAPYRELRKGLQSGKSAKVAIMSLAMSSELHSLVQDFSSQIVALIQTEASERARAAILGAFSGSGVAAIKRGRGRPPGRGRRGRSSGSALLGRTIFRPPISAGRRLHGQYIGRLRSLKGKARARVVAVRKKKGAAEAIKLADRLLRS